MPSIFPGNLNNSEFWAGDPQASLPSFAAFYSDWCNHWTLSYAIWNRLIHVHIVHLNFILNLQAVVILHFMFHLGILKQIFPSGPHKMQTLFLAALQP